MPKKRTALIDGVQLATHALNILIRILPALLTIPMLLGPAALISYLKYPEKSPSQKIALCLLVLGFLGYFFFWLYFLFPEIGKVFSIITSLLFFFALARQKTRNAFLQSMDGDSRNVLLLTTGGSIFYLVVLYFWPSSHTAVELARFRFFEGFSLPEDNQIPLAFARALFESKLSSPLLGNWLSSDRPPLQTGLMLSPYPILVPLFGRDVAYQGLSTLLQCVWIPASWCFLESLGTTGKVRNLTLGICVFASFFYLNGVYVWPKLLGGAFTLLSAYFLLNPEVSPKDRGILSSMAFALALLSHGGSFFAIPLLIVLAYQETHDCAKLIQWGVPVGLALLIPWMLYQRFVDPPGNLLMKWHLAGVIDIDSRDFGQTLWEAYSSLSLDQWLEARWRNFSYLWGRIPYSLEDLRILNFYNLFPSVGLLCVGWIPLLRNSNQRNLQRVAMGILLSLLFWIVFLYIGGTTSIHHGAYGVFIPLFLLGALGLTQLPRGLFLTLSSIHIFLFFILWM